jgi:hypothetical protein
VNNTKICKSLIEKNLLNKDMKISAIITTSGFGFSSYVTEKTGTILDITNDKLIVSFGESTKYVDFNKITKIEGMDFTRFAQAYRVK